MSQSPPARQWNEQHKRWYETVRDPNTGQVYNRWCDRADSLTDNNSVHPNTYGQPTYDTRTPRYTGEHVSYQRSPTTGSYSGNPAATHTYPDGFGRGRGSHYSAPANTPHYVPNQRAHTTGHPTNTASYSVTELPRGEGDAIVPSHPSTLQDHLDPAFQVQHRDFFFEGRVFAIVFNENAGQNAIGYNSCISEVKYTGNYVHSQTRRFVIVRTKREFCFACPIFTYGGRATTKPGVRAEEHGIAYSWGQEPQFVPGESGITKPSMPVVMETNKNLDIASRIYYGIHHPIQYNVKVRAIGYVPPTSVPSLIGNWKAESEGTGQAADVTANEY